MTSRAVGASRNDGPAPGTAFDPADRCAPGEYVPAPQFTHSSEPKHAQPCTGDDLIAAGQAGAFDAMPKLPPDIWSVELAAPMVANEPYSFSLEVEFHGGEGALLLEFAGTHARCGAKSVAVELMELPLAAAKQTPCMEVTPDAAYSHVLLVLRDVDDELPSDPQLALLHGATFCAQGSCP